MGMVGLVKNKALAQKQGHLTVAVQRRACLGDTDGLLLHSLVQSRPVCFLDASKLVNAAHLRTSKSSECGGTLQSKTPDQTNAYHR